MADNGRAPATIEELKQWYEAMELPPEETTRFFIGKNITEPRAFGIYQAEDGSYVVYKNKNDGTRAVRYKGDNQAYAVNELRLRLVQEIANQKSGNSKRGGKNRRVGKIATLVFGGIMVFSILFSIIDGIIHPSVKPGYYGYDDGVYYYSHNDWFYYDDAFDTWLDIDAVDDELSSHTGDYYLSSSYNVLYGASDFMDSEAYQNVKDDWASQDEDSHWDSDDSWDSGSTDFDSDW